MQWAAVQTESKEAKNSRKRLRNLPLLEFFELESEAEIASFQTGQKPEISPRLAPEGVNPCKSLILKGNLGWLMGLEPTTTGITILTLYCLHTLIIVGTIYTNQ